MLHVTCVVLLLIVAVGELTAIRQWFLERDLAGMQQMAAVGSFQSAYPGRN